MHSRPSESHPCPDAPPLPDHLLALARSLRQPRVTESELLQCANQLDALAARATWATVINTNQRELLRKLSLVLDEAGELAHTSHNHAHRMLELLQGAGESTSWHRPDAQGSYAWDRWQTGALAAGLDPELAVLGRAVMREAVQHSWDSDLQAECGWTDAGQAMLELALREGVTAAARWRELLDTDGERGYWDDDTNRWHSFGPCGGRS